MLMFLQYNIVNSAPGFTSIPILHENSKESTIRPAWVILFDIWADLPPHRWMTCQESCELSLSCEIHMNGKVLHHLHFPPGLHQYNAMISCFWHRESPAWWYNMILKCSYYLLSVRAESGEVHIPWMWHQLLLNEKLSCIYAHPGSCT